MPRWESRRVRWTRQDSGLYEAELLLAKHRRMGTKLRTNLRSLTMATSPQGTRNKASW